ncbi:hypothetical protein HpSP79_20000 [Helicobacter pylori]
MTYFSAADGEIGRNGVSRRIQKQPALVFLTVQAAFHPQQAFCFPTVVYISQQNNTEILEILPSLN